MSQYPTNYEQQAPGYGAPAAAKANVPAAALQILGGVVAVVSTFLTWLTVSGNGATISVSGMGNVSGVPDGMTTPDLGTTDGGLIIALGALAIVGGVLLLTVKKGVLGVLAVLGGLVGLIIAIRDLSSINDGIDQISAIGASGSVGIGVWLAIVGSAIALVGGVLGIIGGRKKV